MTHGARILLLLGLASCDRLFGLDGLTPIPVRPDVPLDVCGNIGEACCNGSTCNDGSHCLIGAPGHTRCAAFAGAYETSEPNTCGAPTCLIPNPLTGGCGCPASFGIAVTGSIDEGCGEPANPVHTLGLAQLCGISTLPAGTDWGGAYLSADLPECEPATNPPGCMTPNPITGTCSCPDKAEDVRLRIWVQGVTGPTCANGWLGGTLGMCLMKGVAISTIAGIYQQDIDGNCRSFSSGLATCACPTGSVSSTLQTVEENLAMPPTAFPETTIYICLESP